MRILCIGEILVGAGILLFSILRFYKILADYRLQSQRDKPVLLSRQGLCMLLMLFFFVGYLAMGVFYFLQDDAFMDQNLLVANIFFFGALFVALMVANQRQMYHTINGKRDEIVRALVNAVEAKDQYTRGHSEHVCRLVELFYERLPHAKAKEVNRVLLADAAILHDAGKIGIPDNILNKPGRLTEDEMAVIQEHPRLGKHILDSTSFKDVGDVVMKHHERVDGAGYYAVPWEEVSVESRMIAIADTFSALYSDRCYRSRKSYGVAMSILKEVAGTQLDAELVDIFCKIPRAEIDRVSAGLIVLDETPRDGQSAG